MVGLFIILGRSYFCFLNGELGEGLVNTRGRAWQGIGATAVRFNDL